MFVLALNELDSQLWIILLQKLPYPPLFFFIVVDGISQTILVKTRGGILIADMTLSQKWGCG